MFMLLYQLFMYLSSKVTGGLWSSSSYPNTDFSFVFFFSLSAPLHPEFKEAHQNIFCLGGMTTIYNRRVCQTIMLKSQLPHSHTHVLTHNVQGLNSPTKRAKAFLNYHKLDVDFLLLQEMHFSCTSAPRYLNARFPTFYLSNGLDKK